jgi:N-acetyl-anhydromuramyl-L-alanine amidase AmpD
METIKKGSKGIIVEYWQEFLKNLQLYTYKVDGDFGNLTHNSTIEFQRTNGLVADGIVGKRTWDKAKDWIFIHHTAGWDNPFNTISHWARDSRGQVATEFVLGGQKITNNDTEYDGVVVQAFPEGGYGWHLGIGNNIMHRASVGIEVNNFGWLTEGGYYKRIDGDKTWIKKTPGKFYTYVGTEADCKQVVKLEKEFRGYQYWHKYSDRQILELKKLIQYIGERDGIDVRKGLPELVREKGVEAFDICSVSMCDDTKGLWSHTNCRSTKFDMFPQSELIDMLLSL